MFFSEGPITKTLALAPVMTGRRPGDKSFPELISTQSTDACMHHSASVY